MIFQLCEACNRHGIESHVLYLSASGQVKDYEPYHNHVIHSSKLDCDVASTGISMSSLKKLKALAATVDIIHYHFPWPFMDVAHFTCRINKPSIVTYHSDIVKQKYLLKLYEPLMNKFLSSVDLIVASSPNYTQSSSVLVKHRKNTCVIPFGLDDNAAPKGKGGGKKRWEHRLGKEFFLFVGALRYYKGLDFLLEAAAKTKLTVVIAGGGKEELKLKERARDLGLDNIHFVGMVSDEDKFTLLSMAKAFVFPSHLRSEAFGISLLEAAMLGKPMISCEIGTGTTFINRHEETGLVIPPRDVGALVEAMNRLSDNEELCKQFGAAARQRFEELFSVDVMARKYVEKYREVIEA